jgi:hypothetical protein
VETKSKGLRDAAVVVESKPGAALRVERVRFSDADVKALTTSTELKSGNTTTSQTTTASPLPAESDKKK